MRRRIYKFIGSLAALVVLYTIIGFLLFPVVLRRIAIRELTKALGRNVTIQSIRFNPYALSITVKGFQIDELKGAEPFLSWETFYANFEPWPSLLHRTWKFKEGALLKPHMKVVRNTDGTLNFADLLLLNWPQIPDFRLKLMRLEDGSVVFHDRALPSEFSTTIGPLTGTFKDFSMTPDHKNSYSFSATSEAGETFSWNGFFRLNPFSSHGELAAENVQIKKYYPYFEEFLHFRIADGTLTARATYELDLSQNHFIANLSNGTITARSLKVNEHESNEPLFGFEELALTGAQVDLVRHKIEVASVVTTGGSVGLTLLPNNSLNVQHVIRPIPSPSPSKAVPSVNWLVSAGEIAFENGKLTFTDRSLKPLLKIALTQLDIRIGNFSSDQPKGASVVVKAKMDSVSPLHIWGESNPVHEHGTTRLRGLLQSVNLVPLSPYAAKYLGYEISKGELSLDVTYRIYRRRLHARNKMEIDHLTLGEENDDTEPSGVPIQLAIALLKDSSGKITLDVPIDGTLDDPKFKMKEAIFEALINPFSKPVLLAPKQNATR